MMYNSFLSTTFFTTFFYHIFTTLFLALWFVPMLACPGERFVGETQRAEEEEIRKLIQTRGSCSGDSESSSDSKSFD